jgi:excinuclease UvrABC nuclease subunit
MKIEDLSPFPTNKVRFNLGSFKIVPKRSGCYVLTSFDNNILYIGLAINLNSRLIQHLDSPDKTKPTIEGKAIWFYYLEYSDTNLPKLERSWLNQFSSIHGTRPILNKVDSPIN